MYYRLIILCSLFSFSTLLFATQDSDLYELSINGQNYELELNKPLTLGNKSGQVQLVLSKKFVPEYVDNLPEACKDLFMLAGKNPKDTMAIFGKPSSIDEKVVANQYDPKVNDKFISLNYGLNLVSFYYDTQGDKYLLSYVIFNRSNFTKNMRRTFPDNEAALIKKYGMPPEKTPHEYRYYCNDEGSDILAFTFNDKKALQKVEFTGYF